MVFCDWLSIYQVHMFDVPVVNDGRVFSVDQDGVVKWEVGTKVVHRGSHDTKLRISSDGNRVTLEGNIGRFNRSDNLFGYTVRECVQLANRVLACFGLPPFTDAAPAPLVGPAGKDCGYQASGAVLTRVDLTCNWMTGSAGNASQFMRHLQGFKAGKFEPRPYYTTGVSWGEGSKYWYAKVYDKAADYIRHHGPGSAEHDPVLYDYILNAGIARHEITLKSRYLKQNNLWRFSLWVDGMENKVYALFSDPIRQSVPVDEYLEIKGRAGELAVAWRDGADLKKRLSHNTFYRYRRELLKYGIDIAVPPNVTRLKTRVDVITVSPASVPSWYVLPQVDVA